MPYIKGQGYVRTTKSKEELSALRSQLGKKGAQSLLKSKNFRGGRPKGSPNKNPVPRVPSRTLTVRQPDYEVFVKCASCHNKDERNAKPGVPIVEFMHVLAEHLKAKNPAIFAPDAQKVEM